ncbi:hypothetical protein NX722_23425 [Endozoicomonas gorgoniicola]|uniref:Uncharacterized protein n=1 Tax=Endozoicomonas gorgoniicola TaxID=1234144 RepID=A0ABT3N1L1_9GAMM|nr:hypothetical protein [Endozoicomonas gorgoniicola]MCW7555518.1 hypothetical protein [Endozoicomonas gorgoniicola]
MSLLKKHLEESAINSAIIAMVALKSLSIKSMPKLLSLDEAMKMKVQCERVLAELNRALEQRPDDLEQN